MSWRETEARLGASPARVATSAGSGAGVPEEEILVAVAEGGKAEGSVGNPEGAIEERYSESMSVGFQGPGRHAGIEGAVFHRVLLIQTSKT